MTAYETLKGLSRYLPPSVRTRLQTQYRRYWENRQQSDVAKRQDELLLAPLLPQYSIGRHTVGKPDVRHGADTQAQLTIGDYCSIAEGVTIMLGEEHGTDWVTTYPFAALWPQGPSLQPPKATKGDVTIGNDVWIGTHSLLLSGTTIGDGAVIGAGSVVRGRIPPYAIAVGNPCRTVMYRFKPEEISTLLALRWWDWTEEVIGEALPLLLSKDIPGITEFARAHSLLAEEPESQQLTT
jgi:acetyltransferase-like isoleucine patch superfamily enzyme